MENTHRRRPFYTKRCSSQDAIYFFVALLKIVPFFGPLATAGDFVFGGTFNGEGGGGSGRETLRSSGEGELK